MSTLPPGSIPVKCLRWRWLEKPIYHCILAPEGLPGRLEIDGAVYLVRPIGHLPVAGGAVCLGYRLEKEDGTTYDLEGDGEFQGCECKGFLRWGHCKHLKVLTAALQALRAA